MNKQVRVYRPKRLIDGAVVGKQGMYVAVPDRNYKDAIISVRMLTMSPDKSDTYVLEEMIIKDWHKAEAFRRFHDVNNGTPYLLGYFPWRPGSEIA